MCNGCRMPAVVLIPSVEVCAILGIDRSTLSRWVAAGKLTPAMRVGKGNAFLFNRRHVERLAKQQAA